LEVTRNFHEQKSIGFEISLFVERVNINDYTTIYITIFLSLYNLFIVFITRALSFLFFTLYFF